MLCSIHFRRSRSPSFLPFPLLTSPSFYMWPASTYIVPASPSSLSTPDLAARGTREGGRKKKKKRKRKKKLRQRQLEPDLRWVGSRMCSAGKKVGFRDGFTAAPGTGRRLPPAARPRAQHAIPCTAQLPLWRVMWGFFGGGFCCKTQSCAWAISIRYRKRHWAFVIFRYWRFPDRFGCGDRVKFLVVKVGS